MMRLYLLMHHPHAGVMCSHTQMTAWPKHSLIHSVMFHKTVTDLPFGVARSQARLHRDANVVKRNLGKRYQPVSRVFVHSEETE